MGTLLGGVAGVCIFAGLLASAHSTLDHAASSRGEIRATANHIYQYEIEEPEPVLRVLETHRLDDAKGVVVFDRSGSRDSLVVDLGVLEQLGEGDILSEYGGVIER